MRSTGFVTNSHAATGRKLDSSFCLKAEFLTASGLVRVRYYV